MRCWLMVMFDNFRFRNSRVNWIDMSLSMSWSSKSFSTVWTLIGFHSSVKSHMAFQGVFTQKLVLAYVTFNWIWNNKNSGCNKSTSTILNFFIHYISAIFDLGCTPQNIINSPIWEISHFMKPNAYLWFLKSEFMFILFVQEPWKEVQW